PPRPRRDPGPPYRAHPAGPPAHLPYGSRASRGRRGRGRRRVLAGAPRSPDRTAVPERRQRAVLHALRGLHPREVLSPFAVRRVRPGGRLVRRLRPRRRLGPATPRHGDRPEPAAPVTDDPMRRPTR